MLKNKNQQNFLIEILEKKAKGYYYDEVQYEYQKTQKTSKQTEKQVKSNENLNFFEIIDRGTTNFEDDSDMIKLSEKTNEKQNENYELVKKKVSSHYIQPDIQAIKLLLEIYENNNTSNSISNLSDEELISLKNKLIKELSNED